MGVSLGGFVAEQLCVTHPRTVKAAVLLASAGPTTEYMRVRITAERELFQACHEVPKSYDLWDSLLVGPAGRHLAG